MARKKSSSFTELKGIKIGEQWHLKSPQSFIHKDNMVFNVCSEFALDLNRRYSVLMSKKMEMCVLGPYAKPYSKGDD